ncbi:MAG: hypothetical protein KJ831_08560, partial [Candidatus Eisenbacteria bacterium]|nr:hypothetical protein [Candidatus Eisenbacteria bacterium]
TEIAHKGIYDPNEHQFIRHNSQLRIHPHEDYAFTFWHGWIRHRQEDLKASVRRILTDKWEVEAGLNFDLVENKTGDRFVMVRRRAHQWLFELSVEIDRGDQDTSVSLSITPLALVGRKTKGSIYDPMQMD